MALTPTTPLTVLRLAMSGQPSARELARQIGCSQQLLASFERGLARMGDDYMAKYAKLVGASVAEVRKRWLVAALDATNQRRAELMAELRRLGVKDPRVRHFRKSA